MKCQKCPGRHELAIPALVRGIRACAASAGRSLELLVNVDSRTFRSGDVGAWLRALTPGTFPDEHFLNRIVFTTRSKTV